MSVISGLVATPTYTHPIEALKTGFMLGFLSGLTASLVLVLIADWFGKKL